MSAHLKKQPNLPFQTLWTDFSIGKPSAAGGSVLQCSVTMGLVMQGTECRGCDDTRSMVMCTS